MKQSLFIVLVLFSLLTGAQELSERTFAVPSREYGPMSWWHWVNGNVTKQGILNDLIAMHKNGMRGVQMFNAHMYLPKGPVKFGSDEWIELVKYAVEVCDSLQMKFTCMNAAGWSGASGPWITPERAMKKLVFTETNIEGGVRINILLQQPPTIDNYYRDIATIAIPAEYPAGQIENLDAKILMSNSIPLDCSYEKTLGKPIPLHQIINISKYVNNGKLNWNVPTGKWTIIRFGYTLTGKQGHPNAWGGEGYECDKLDAKHVIFQFEQCLGKLLKKTRKYLGNTFEGILFDSYEAHFQNWTGIVPQEFEKLNGYSLIPYLPLFTGRYVEDVVKSERVLWDFRRLLDTLLAKNFYGKMQELSNQHNLIIYAEGQGGPVSSSYVYDYIDIPMNEFWTPDTKPRYNKIKLTASLGNMQNKQIIAAEAFTSTPENGKWQNTPWRMKKCGDLAFAAGINRYCFHSYAHQPFNHTIPGFTMGRYGAMFNRHLTWWNYASSWFNYITRSQYMLQQGKTVADIAFLFHDDIRYSFSNEMIDIPTGYNYQIIYPKHLSGAVFENGQIVLRNGLKFKLLILANNSKIDIETLKILQQLILNGAIVSGMPPAGIPSQFDYSKSSQIEFNAIVTDIWGGLEALEPHTKKYGKGKVYWGGKTEDIIKSIFLTPDINYCSFNATGKFYHLHRQLPNEDIYYITNQEDETYSLTISFRITNKIPEIWDPKTGTITKASNYQIGTENVTVTYDFAPYESIFIVFRKDCTTSPPIHKKENSPIKITERTINKGWIIEFTDKQQKISQPIKTNKLFLWNESVDPRIKYYSGTATYTNKFYIKERQLKDAKIIQLELGAELYNIAEILVNGKNLGVLWSKPWSLNIANAVKPGINTLEIRVANTWINRIIGDEAYPDDAKYETEGTKFTINRASELPKWIYNAKEIPADRKRITYTTWKHYNADSPLVPSGLQGPVKIKFHYKKK